MLNSVRIYSYRSCRDTIIDNIEGILVLIGRNGAGKTNILKAIEWAGNTCNGPIGSPTDWMQMHDLPDVELEFSLMEGNRSFLYRAKINADPRKIRDNDFAAAYWPSQSLREITPSGEITIFSLDAGQLSTSDDLQTSVSVGITANAFDSISSLFPDAPNIHAIKSVARFLRGIKYYSMEVASESQPFFTQDKFDAWEAARAQTQAPDDISLKLVSLKRKFPDKFEELQSLLGPEGLDLLSTISIHEFSIDSKNEESPRFFIVQFQPSGGRTNEHFYYNDLAFGTRRILSLLLAVMHDPATVGLVEQPEDGIHAALLKKIIPLLRHYTAIDPTQFVIATHSSYVLNEVMPEEVRFVAASDGKSRIRKLTEDQVAIAKEHTERVGSLSEVVSLLEDE